MNGQVPYGASAQRYTTQKFLNGQQLDTWLKRTGDEGG